jgi:hypothetical protein
VKPATARYAPARVSPQTLRDGVDVECSRFTIGGRVLLVARLASGSHAIVTAMLDPRGDVDRVLGVFAFNAARGTEIDHVISMGLARAREITAH